MARYTKELTLNLPVKTVKYVVEDYLQKGQFTAADWQGESCFRTGGTMMGYKWLKWSYGGGVFHLEAWLEGRKGKEIGLDGLVGAASKLPYKANLEQLLETLQAQPQAGAAPASGRGKGAAAVASDSTVAQPSSLPKTVDSAKQAIAGLAFGILALISSLLVSYLLGFCLGFVGMAVSQFGMQSSKAILAKVGMALSIAAVVMSALKVIVKLLMMIGLLSAFVF